MPFTYQFNMSQALTFIVICTSIVFFNFSDLLGLYGMLKLLK